MQAAPGGAGGANHQTGGGMRRFRLLAILVVLAACGTTITINVPGVEGGSQPPRGYAMHLSPAAHAFAFVAEPVRRGRRAERFELRQGDCTGSDCEAGRFRAEIREQPEAVQAVLGREIWYGWSFRNENIAAVSRETSLGLVLGQWKLEGPQPPIFRLTQSAAGEGNWASCDPAVCNRNGSPADDVVVELEDMRVTRNWGSAQNNGMVCRLFSLSGTRGQWVDIVVQTNFSIADDGYLNVWVNGVQKCAYRGPLVASTGGATVGPSQRRGIFASFTRRFTESQGGAPIPTMVAYYDEFLTGPGRTDVDTRLREGAGLPPKD
jgi:hypothetical protein